MMCFTHYLPGPTTTILQFMQSSIISESHRSRGRARQHDYFDETTEPSSIIL